MVQNKQSEESENIVEVNGVPLRVHSYKDIENIISTFQNPTIILKVHKYTREKLKLKKENERILKNLIKSGKLEVAFKK